MGKSKTDPSEDKAPDTWINHFKSLFNIDYATNFDPKLNTTQFQYLDNAILNKAISAEEVKKSNKGIKEWKGMWMRCNF